MCLDPKLGDMDRRGPASTLEDISQPPGKPEAPTPPASLGERAALTLALWMAAVCIGLPAIVLFWMLTVSLTTTVTAEALRQTDGLKPTTFGGGYWLAMGVNVIVVAWSLGRRLRGRPAPWTPLAVLAITYLVLIWVAVFPELFTTLDMPDVLTTFVLLGADAMMGYVFPVVLLVLLVRGMWLLRRIGQRSSVAAQRIGIAAVFLGLGCLTLGIGLATVPLEPRTFRAAAQGFVDSLAGTGVDGELKAYDALSSALGSGLYTD